VSRINSKRTISYNEDKYKELLSDTKSETTKEEVERLRRKNNEKELKRKDRRTSYTIQYKQNVSERLRTKPPPKTEERKK